jgi:hypothetical protein
MGLKGAITSFETSGQMELSHVRFDEGNFATVSLRKTSTFARHRASIVFDWSTPVTTNPAWAAGMSIRPVPQPSSSA